MTIAASPEQALIALLAAWRTARSSKLADAIDRVSLVIARTPITTKTVAARTLEWMAIAETRDPLDVGRLLAVPLPRQVKPLSKAIDILVGWDDDPRVAVALARFIEDGILTTAAGRRLEFRALGRIGVLRDARVVGRLRAATGGYRRSGFPFDDVIAQVEAAERDAVLDDAALALVERYGGGEADADTARLLDAVHADPDDRAAIEVLGDRLGEIGDPRGELISLQLAAPTEANERRIRELVEQHGRTWTGELDRYFAEDHRVFERGFFAGGLLLASSDVVDDIVKDPAWALVRTLHVAPPSELLGNELLARPELRGLRAYGIATLSHGIASPTLHELHVRSDIALPLALGAAFPALRALGIWTRYRELAAWCAQATLVERLERIVLVTDGEEGTLDALAARGGALRTIELVYSTDQFHAVWCVRVSRDAAPGPFTRVTIEYRPTDDTDITLAAKLGAIPSTWPREVIVETHDRMIAASDARTIETHLARFTNVAKTSLPWERAQRGRTVSISVPRTQGGQATILPALWKALAAFGQSYDAFSINRRDTLRPLGAKPLERALSWLAKQGTFMMTLQRTGGAERVRMLSGIEIDVTVGERSYDELATWFPTLVAAAGSDHATIYAATMRGTWQIESFGTLPDAGWVMQFGAAASAYLDLDEVRALSAHPALPELFASSVDGHLIVGLARDPDGATKEMWPVFAGELRAILYRGFVATAGYDFDVLATTAFGAMAARHGLERRDRGPLHVEYLRQGAPGSPRASIGARIDAAVAPPRLSIALHAWPTHENTAHRPVEAVPIASRADLETQLAIAVQAFTEVEPWLMKHLSPD